MDITSALALGRRLLREHGLEHWSMRTDRAKTRAGVCRFAPRVISLSEPLTRLHSEDEVRDTILHEIAHALVGPDHGHDDVWRAKAIEIGCSGERTVSADSPMVEGPWRGVCASGHLYSRHRRPGRVMSCLSCSPEFDAEALLSWTYEGRRVDMGAAYRRELDSILAAHPSTRVVPTNTSAAGTSTPGTGSPAGTDSPSVTSTLAASSAARSFVVGEAVRVVVDGPMRDVVGEVEAAFPTKSQVRFGDELYSVPNEALVSAEQLAS